MLIIPALYLLNEKCKYLAIGEEGTEGSYPCDPVAVVKMWRSENAKALHIIDIDSSRAGCLMNRQIIKEMTASVDIPIQLGGGLRTYEDVRSALVDLGAYRVILSAAAVEAPELVKELTKEFGPRRIVVGLDVLEQTVRIRRREKEFKIPVLDHTLHMKELGIQRIVYTDLQAQKNRTLPSLKDIYSLAKATDISFTLYGMVWNYKDLKAVQSLFPRNIDSLILDEPLYYNAFPCQRIWRKAEKMLIEGHRFIP